MKRSLEFINMNAVESHYEEFFKYKKAYAALQALYYFLYCDRGKVVRHDNDDNYSFTIDSDAWNELTELFPDELVDEV